MARPIWTGAISFGLVNVPVKLYPAVRQKEVHFNMLHEKDGARIRQKRVCSLEEEEVPYDEIAKGYEVSSGRYVVLTRDELETLDPKATRSIDLEDFIDLEDIDPIFYESTYYLAPDKSASKAYALLLEAMTEIGKIGIARMVMRTKQYLCAVRPYEGVLALSTMQYADEIVSVEDLEELPDKQAKPRPKELEMAKQLVQSLSGKFEPQKYHDEYRERVLELIQKKSRGQEIVAPEEEARPAKVVSLMDALEKSLASARKVNGSVTSGKKAEASADEQRGERRHVAQAARTLRSKKRPAPRKGKNKKKSA